MCIFVVNYIDSYSGHFLEIEIPDANSYHLVKLLIFLALSCYTDSSHFLVSRKLLYSILISVMQ